MPRAIIIGAGPAGLTTALELIRRSGIQPIILESSDYIGGIARTVKYKGNRIDIGGHRFFSKSDRVMNWWLEIMPVENGADAGTIAYQGQRRTLDNSKTSPEASGDTVMLVRNRKSRIYFLRQFFDYPLKLSVSTLMKLGVSRTIKIGVSYAAALAHPIHKERSLEDFLINRFGRELYRTFFQGYTEKVWGVPCGQISAEWGAQRIKGLDIVKVLKDSLHRLLPRKNTGDISQKKVETSLIERFLYPKFGPGQLWETVAELVKQGGGEIHQGWNVDKVECAGDSGDGKMDKISAVWATHVATGERKRFEGDYFFSTMPVKELIAALDALPPENVRQVSEGLLYRDFITVGLLMKRLSIADRSPDGATSLVKDNWIYIQEPDVMVGRLQIFNNWSPFMVADPGTVWIGLEYFCYETDDIWKKSDADLVALGTSELERIGILKSVDVLDSVVIRMPKTYPAYFGSYDRFNEIREHTDGFKNLFLVGRNGMHKYNNQDHSMLTAMMAVDNILAGKTTKENIWDVNAEMEYHESK
jgi:protoporphyrinogen oxidase